MLKQNISVAKIKTLEYYERQLNCKTVKVQDENINYDKDYYFRRDKLSNNIKIIRRYKAQIG